MRKKPPTPKGEFGKREVLTISDYKLSAGMTIKKVSKKQNLFEVPPPRQSGGGLGGVS